MRISWQLFLLALVALHLCDLGAGSRILAAFVFPGKSHFMMTNAIIRELVKRGHEVTFITPFSLAKENLGPNYKEVLIAQYDFWPELIEKTKAKSVLDMNEVSTLTFIELVNIMGVKSTDFAFDQPQLKALIDEKNKIGKYDLLLAEQFFNEGALILGHLYQIPTITVSTFGFANYLSQVVGIVSPWSYVPHGFMPFTDRLTLWQRIQNILISGTEDLMRKFIYYPQHDEVLRKHFSHRLEKVPTIKELESNISLLLLNSYMPLETPRPVSYNMISVGGLHIQPNKVLPEDLQKFLDGATDGAIYFSLGSQVRSADLPPEKLKVFLDVFGSLKQRVLWKFEDEKLPNLPANVRVQNWMPQNEILAHPNVKVFIAHGGLFGTQEAINYGVPILGMPVYCDQHLNINKGKANGYALGLDYRTVTEDELRSSLKELIENPSYKAKMQQASQIFRDRPLSAMDTAMYWIDYVIKHRGAPHMKAVGVDLPWYQFYLVDIVAIALTIIFLPILGLLALCRRRRSKTSSGPSPKRKSKKN